MDKVKRIKENFENQTYSLLEVPRVLAADNRGVYLHKDGLNQDEIESLEHMNWARDKITTQKLKVKSWGGYELWIGLIGTQYFDSHEMLDTLYSINWLLPGQDDLHPPIERKRIFLEDGMNLLEVKMSCDMDYYLTNRDEMQTDLNRSLDGVDLGEDNVLEQLQNELFRKQTIKVFGESEDGGAIVFEDFHLLHNDGNDVFATAKRGNNFWIIFFESS